MLFFENYFYRTDIVMLEKEKRDKERIRKANWRQRKKIENPEYFTKLHFTDRDRKRLKRKLSQQVECPDTPKKKKSPSYYMVLNKSKEVRNILTESPETHTTILKHVLKHTMKSPRKKAILHEGTVDESDVSSFITPSRNSNLIANRISSVSETSGSVSKEIRKIAILKSHRRRKEAMKKAVDLKNRYSSIKSIADEAAEDPKDVYRILSEPRKRVKSEYVRKLNDEMKEEVRAIYNNDEVSYCLPDIKYAGLRFMSITIEEAYKIYLKKCTNKRKVASKTFAALKPVYIKTMQKTPMRGSRCDYCTNLGLIRKTIVGLGIEGIPLNHSAAIEKIWCPFRATNIDEMDI